MKKPLWKRAGLYFSLIALAAAAYFCYELCRMNILTMSLLVAVCLLVLVIWCICALVITKSGSNRFGRVLCWILIVVLTIGSAAGGVFCMTGADVAENIYADDTKNLNIYNVYVKNDSAIDSVAALNEKKVGILEASTSEANEEITKALATDKANVTLEAKDSAAALLKALNDGEVDAIVLDPSYVNALADLDDYKSIKEQLRSVFDGRFETEKTSVLHSIDTGSAPFNILISGIDTRENAMSKSSLSDMNMILSVNPSTGRILMVSIPSQMLVETACFAEMGCAQGSDDTIADTGLHGVETTELSLENLFGIDINYNIRINIDSLVRIVQVLGGVTVNNPAQFTAADGQVFPEGQIVLNANEALTYAREKAAFAKGERPGGSNQMALVQAIISKSLKPANLLHINDILDVIKHSVETNMPAMDAIKAFTALAMNAKSINVYQFSISGKEEKRTSKDLGADVTVIVPDKDVLAKAKDDLKAIAAGEIPPYMNE